MKARLAKDTILNLNDTFKVVLVTGPRQCGKKTLLKELIPKDMTYVTLEEESLRKKAKENLKGFLEEFPGKLFIDEVQYAPELLPYIKMNIDSSAIRGQYWLTGSQQFNLMKNVSESLAGRLGILNLNSFSYAEVVENKNFSLFDPINLKKSDYIIPISSIINIKN